MTALAIMRISIMSKQKISMLPMPRLRSPWIELRISGPFGVA